MLASSRKYNLGRNKIGLATWRCYIQISSDDYELVVPGTDVSPYKGT